MSPPLGYSLAPYILKSKTLFRWVKPVADWYANAMRYRKYGFKYDDLLLEERPDVQRALNRLTLRQQYDRAYRLKRASQLSIMNDILPQEQWTKPEDDVRYLATHVEDVHKEDVEREAWDNISVQRRRK